MDGQRQYGLVLSTGGTCSHKVRLVADSYEFTPNPDD
jgi:hypothetical protein